MELAIPRYLWVHNSLNNQIEPNKHLVKIERVTPANGAATGAKSATA